MGRAELMEEFEEWWWQVGSGITQKPDEDQEEHAKRVARSAYIFAVMYRGEKWEAMCNKSNSRQ